MVFYKNVMLHTVLKLKIHSNFNEISSCIYFPVFSNNSKSFFTILMTSSLSTEQQPTTTNNWWGYAQSAWNTVKETATEFQEAITIENQETIHSVKSSIKDNKHLANKLSSASKSINNFLSNTLSTINENVNAFSNKTNNETAIKDQPLPSKLMINYLIIENMHN